MIIKFRETNKNSYKDMAYIEPSWRCRKCRNRIADFGFLMAKMSIHASRHFIHRVTSITGKMCQNNLNPPQIYAKEYRRTPGLCNKGIIWHLKSYSDLKIQKIVKFWSSKIRKKIGIKGACNWVLKKKKHNQDLTWKNLYKDKEL